MKEIPTKYLVAGLIGILIVIAWLRFTGETPKLHGTTLREYRLMDRDARRLLILESRRALFHKYLDHVDIERASCVARLFDAKTEDGIIQIGKIEEILETEADRSINRMVEEIATNFIKTNFCP